MEGKKLTNIETKVTEVISFILEQFRNEKVNQDMEVCSELILIARILHQRFRISNGTQVKSFIKDYREFMEKNINKIL